MSNKERYEPYSLIYNNFIIQHSNVTGTDDTDLKRILILYHLTPTASFAMAVQLIKHLGLTLIFSDSVTFNCKTQASLAVGVYIIFISIC